MNIIFSSPLLLSAFLAVPALVAIYLLRSRYRTRIVSSLILWIDQRKPKQGGLQISRIQTPLLFLLELLTIIMLVLAAAGPLVRAADETRLFIIILDDSFSMLASDGRMARQKAVDDIRDLLETSGRFNARFILAGKTPQLLGTSVKMISQADELLAQWKCLCPAADLNAAVALAAELGAETARILVITDHEPEIALEEGRLEWWAFGKSLPNLAFVNASRVETDTKDRCMLMIANLSNQSAEATLKVLSFDKSQKLLEQSVELEPEQEYRVLFEPPSQVGPLRAILADDALDIDNELILLPQPYKPVRLLISLKDDALKAAVEKAVEAIKQARQSSLQPHIIITDSSAEDFIAAGSWMLKIISEPNASAYIGPFVVDRTHPLTDGLSMNNVIWSAAKSDEYSGSAVISAGNVPLITDRELPTGSHNITMQFVPELSNLSLSPNWPIFFWNLVQWRKSFLPGLIQSNFKLASTVSFIAESVDNDIELTDPENITRQLPLVAKTALVEPDMPGLYKLKESNNEHLFAVNPISKSESNLVQAADGKWGQWQQASLYWWEYREFDWLLLLIALILLTFHRLLVARQQKGTLI